MNNLPNDTRFVIAFLVKGEASNIHQKLVDGVSDKLGLNKINTPSHMTLKDNFYCSDTSEVEAVIEETIKDIVSPGKIVLDGIDNFRDEILYIKTDLDENAFTVFKSLLENLRKIEWLQWDQFDNLERHFHLTITNKANASNVSEIKKYLKDIKVNFELPFNNISILRKLEDEKRWVVHKEFNF